MSLSFAAQRGHGNVVKALLALDGGNPDPKDSKYGMTPLALAVWHGHEAVVKLLLATDGVDPDSKSWNGALVIGITMRA